MKSSQSNVFVFVVCGAKEHIDTLHFSLNYLKHFSLSDIIVVTDSTRNEIPVLHENVIDIKTPETFDHHQASIWVKTSLHRILPEGPLYCYLDTDIIAMNAGCDSIFSHYNPPVTFAPDHCTVSWFSPYAVKCTCSETATREWNEAEKAISGVLHHPAYPSDMNQSGTRKIFAVLQQLSSRPFANIPALFKILWAFIAGKSKIRDGVSLNTKKKQWETVAGDSFPLVFAFRNKIKKQTGYQYKILQNTWLKPDGKPLAQNRCTHLHEAIAKIFSIPAPETDWQHWNGGVFLFDNMSTGFMDEWHQKTMAIFEDPYWKTRDQGTLIATAVSQNLTHHPTLSQEFNFIADFYKPEIKAHTANPGTFYIGDKAITPSLIHIYHHFGHGAWDVWNSVEAINPAKNNNPELLPENKKVHALWIGDKLTSKELLTIRSFLLQGHSFYLWLYKPLKTQVPKGCFCMDASTIIPEASIFRYNHKNQFGHGKGSLGGFSDIFRYKLLYEHGGWWTDMDITCLKPMNFPEPYVFRTHQSLSLVGNLMKCPPHSDLMKICYEKAIAEINADNRDWHKPIQILVDEVKNLKLEKYIRDYTNPDSWKLIRRMLTTSNGIKKQWHAIHWVNEEWRRNNVDPDCVIPNSVYWKLLKNNGLEATQVSSSKKIVFRIKQSYPMAVWRQLPWIMKKIFFNHSK